jgi:tetratricopeptide (TPR) repeat protein
MKMIGLAAVVYVGALAGCSPADILANQGSRLRSTDFVQAGIDEQRKRSAQEEAEQAPIKRLTTSAQGHWDLFEYKEAVSDWKEAYRLSNDPIYLLRVAEGQRAMGDCAEAGLMYQQYLDKRADAPDRADVKAKLDETGACQKRAGSHVTSVRQYYQSGVTHYELSEYDAAVKDFKEAYRLSNDPAYLFNIAQSYRLQRKCGDAMQFYQRYLTNVGEISNRDKVQARVDEMRACSK